MYNSNKSNMKFENNNNKYYYYFILSSVERSVDAIIVNASRICFRVRSYVLTFDDFNLMLYCY